MTTSASGSPIESHETHRDRFLAHAEDMLRQGDRMQASEKGWLAAAHALKVIAKARHWPLASHFDNVVIAHYIAERMGNRVIGRNFRVAESLHQNAYEDRYPREIVEESLEDVKELIALLRDAHDRLPPTLPPPGNETYRSRHRLRS